MKVCRSVYRSFLPVALVLAAVCLAPPAESQAPADPAQADAQGVATNAPLGAPQDSPEPPAAAEAPEMEPPGETQPEPGTGRGWEWSSQRIFRWGEDYTLEEGERVREVVVLFGSARILGTVDRDVVVVGGSVTVEGEVGGDLVDVLGTTTLGPNAVIRQNAVAIGDLRSMPGAKVQGQRVKVPITAWIPRFTWLTDWLKHGLLLGRPLPPQVPWVWMAALGCALVYFLVGAIFSRGIQRCTCTLDQRPLGSFFMGILLLLLFAPLLLLLAATGVGILVIPFVLCAMIGAYVFGKVAVYRYAGEQLIGQFGAGTVPAPLAALTAGIGIFYLLYMVPFLGFIVWGLLLPLSVGAASLAAFGGAKKEKSPQPATASAESLAVHQVSVPVLPERRSPDAASAGPVAPGQIPPKYAPDWFEADPALLPRAGFWRRFWATLLDGLVIGALSAMTGSLPFFLIAWGAYLVGMWSWKGTTLGGTILGVKVVRTNGEPVDFAVALIRFLGSIFSTLVLFLGHLWVGWNREKQGWHDKIAGTVVVKVPKGFSLV